MEFSKLILLYIWFYLHNLCKSQYNYYNNGMEVSSSYRCPIVFTTQSTPGSRHTCRKIKGPGRFVEKDVECFGNMLELEFYKKMSRLDDAGIDHNLLYWTDYVRVYDHGPFISWHAKDPNIGKPKEVLEKDPMNGSDMCAVANLTSGRLHAVGCNEKYYSICIVSSYGKREPNDICPYKYLAFTSPIPTCLRDIQATNKEYKTGKTSSEVSALCGDYSGYLMQHGYIYSNHPEFENDLKSSEFPVGIKGDKKEAHWTIPDAINDFPIEVPAVNWEGFKEFSALSFKDGIFTFKPQYYKYTNFICEHSPKIPIIIMNLSLQMVLGFQPKPTYKMSLVLEVKGDQYGVDDSKIVCFTDSVTYYPTKVALSRQPKFNMYPLKFIVDANNSGYYWCLKMNTVSYKPPESNRVLFLPSGKPTSKAKEYLIQFPTVMDTQDIDTALQRNFTFFTYKRVYKNNSVLIHSDRQLKTTNVRYNVLFERDIHYYDNFPRIHEASIGKSFVNNDTSQNDARKEDYNYKIKDAYKQIPTTEQYEGTISDRLDGGIYKVIDNLKAMLHSPVTPGVLENATQDVNSVLLLKDVEIPQTLAGSFDDLLNAVEIPKNEAYIKIVQSNIAVLVAKRSGPAPIVGIKVQRIGTDGINDAIMQPLTDDDMLDPELYESNNDIVAKVPSALCHGNSGKLSFTLFKDDAAFANDDNSNWQVNSRVLSISLDNKTCFKKSDYVDIHFRPFDNRSSKKKTACAYWDFDHGNWSTNICILLPSESRRTLDICRCYHMTHFAQIIRYNDIENEKEQRAVLSRITYASCTLSLIGLTIICLTGVISQTWRAEFSNQVWLNLSLSFAVFIISSLVISVMDFNLKHPSLCVGSGAVLHFSVLTTFSWMLLSAHVSYKKIRQVSVDNAPYKLFKYCVFGWIFPIVPIGILLFFDSDSYILNFERMNFCYPTGRGFWLTVFFPVLFIVVFNTSLFMQIAYNLFKNSSLERNTKNRLTIKKISTSFLMFLLYGLIWMIGFFSNNIYLVYIFRFTTTAQGFIFFILFIIFNSKSRKIWRTSLGIQNSKNIPDDTNKNPTSDNKFESVEIECLTDNNTV